MITKGELHYVIEILEELMALADPSEYLEEEAAEAINILRSLNLEEINMNDENVQNATEVAFTDSQLKYAQSLFDMLSAENEYQIGSEVLEYINDNPVSEDDQSGVTVALKSLIDKALAAQLKEATGNEDTDEDNSNPAE